MNCPRPAALAPWGGVGTVESFGVVIAFGTILGALVLWNQCDPHNMELILRPAYCSQPPPNARNTAIWSLESSACEAASALSLLASVRSASSTVR